MGRKGNTIMPFLQDALDNNKYSKYLMYINKENGIFQLTLPRMSKNIKEEDMQLLKDWHAAKGDKFDYKKVKQNALATLKRSSDEVELIGHEKNDYICRIFLPPVPTRPVLEFIPVEGALTPLQSPLKYKPSITSKRSPPEEVLRHIRKLNTYDVTHSKSKLKKVVRCYNSYKKSFRIVSENLSVGRTLKLFKRLGELQAVLENYLRSYLRIQSFLIENLNQKNEAAGFPIPGFLRNDQNQREWEENAPKILVGPETSLNYQEYRPLDQMIDPFSEESGVNIPIFEFAKQFMGVNDQIFQGLLHMRKQSIESASLIEEVEKAVPLPTTSTSKDNSNLENKPEKCFLNELLFTSGTHESKEDITNRIAELVGELKRVSSSNKDTQDRLLLCAIQGKKKQLTKEEILKTDHIIFEAYSKLFSKSTKDAPPSRKENSTLLLKQLDKAIKKRVKLVLEEQRLSKFYADEDIEEEMEDNLNFDTDEIEDEHIKQEIKKAFGLK